MLSFPCDGAYMGDVLVSTETAYEQVRHSRRLTFESNLKRLMLHGLLHLMGYDHEIDDGEMIIEKGFDKIFFQLLNDEGNPLFSLNYKITFD